MLRLARAFLENKGTASMPLSTNAAEALLLFDWPYNVRQLENVIYAAAVRAERAGTVRCEHLPEEIGRVVAAREDAAGKRSAAPPPPPLEALVARDQAPTAEQFKLVTERLGGNIARIAEFFGKDRKQVYRWAERFGVDPGEHRDDE
jgi:DNA-binding NtrC family response regulator